MRGWLRLRNTAHAVALRKESVDRNSCWLLARISACVALRKESVDRNLTTLGGSGVGSWSLSARRAWIEIGCALRQLQLALWSLSARRAWIEIITQIKIATGCVSLSARRAWIEIQFFGFVECLVLVALRKESVDRNICVIEEIIAFNRRSPQGERG